LGLMRRQLHAALADDYEGAMLREAGNQRAARGTADSMEGGMAFLQKRKAAFKGV
jgi:2-(1,2-epoxy-1,2-dihydrophenyl)acetyl-CoA isomerase